MGVSNSKPLKFIFDEVNYAPEDVIFDVLEAFKKDKNSEKINLSVGAYRDDDGKPIVMKAVRLAEKKIIDDGMDKEYPPITGIPEFNKLVARLIFGEESSILKEGRIFTAQSISGAGALTIGGTVLLKYLPVKVMYYTVPTWGNHVPLFTKVGFEMRPYRYYDSNTLGIDETGMMEDISKMPPGCVILLHACGHNPTGVDPSKKQWKQMSDLIKSREIFPFFDMAYQGFASGDVNEDAYSIRLFAEEGHQMMVAQSFAKNMGLYGERAGSLSLVCDKSETAAKVGSHIRRTIRTMYSVPPVHGARIAMTILGCVELKNQWLTELKDISGRIQEMRVALKSGLEREGSKRNWDHITNQIGMFCFTGLSEEQVMTLRKKYAVYLTADGRVSMAGFNTKNIENLVKYIHEITAV